MNNLTLTFPDDWHVHLRDGTLLSRTVADVARYSKRAIVMPNLAPPVTTCDQAYAYRKRILQALPARSDFTPLMTLYLTDNTEPDEIDKALDSQCVYAVKYYPAGATTNSDSGVTDIIRCDAVFARMQDLGLPLLIHGEVTDAQIDIFDREAVFIERTLKPLMTRFPALKIVFEHITTAEAVDFVSAGPETIAATITAQHLLYNRNDMLVGGIRPHFYCLPILKRNRHQIALREAAASGNPKFFLGTDSAPHMQGAKESSCGCAGCYTACNAIEMYADFFEQMDALDKLEGFASHFGPDFYGLPRNTATMQLAREPWTLAAHFQCNDNLLVPLQAEQTVNWKIVEH